MFEDLKKNDFGRPAYLYMLYSVPSEYLYQRVGDMRMILLRVNGG
jgi:hypothetical protein